MCTLILLRGVVEGFPVVLAMNRDEFLDRPSGPPRPWGGDVVAPEDRRAGGTWFGVNRQGLAVALTNRGRERDPAKRSRGLLALDLLAAGDLASARGKFAAEASGARYNGFNALLAAGEGAHFGFLDAGGFREIEGAPGLSILTNEGLNDPGEAKVAAVHDFLADRNLSRLAPAVDCLKLAVVRHDVPVCRHGEDRGTRSCTLWALSEAGVEDSRLEFADGPPCTTPFADHSHLLRGWR